MIIFWFYVLLTVISCIAISEFVHKSNVFEAEINDYFQCEFGGHDPENPCDRENVERTISPIPVILAYALLGLLSLTNLTFVISFQDLKATCSKAWSAATVSSKNMPHGFSESKI